MPHPEQQFRWRWELTASPAALWPLVSNTDRFNRDCGYPPVTALPRLAEPGQAASNLRRLRATVLGIPIEWNEVSFEWIEPKRFSVQRTYRRGPLAKMTVVCELVPRVDGGTTLMYNVDATPSGWLGRLVAPFTIGRRAGARMTEVFRRYDALASAGQRMPALTTRPKLASGGGERMAAIAAMLVAKHDQPIGLIAKLQELITTGDDSTVARLRPYAVADEWSADRGQVLHLFLHATRAGLLDFSWDLVCPHCRGAKRGPNSLGEVSGHGHCDTCNVDFTANFDQSVELTFVPNPAIRPVTRTEYCLGGPQVTPHIVAQQSLAPGASVAVPLQLNPGRYRVRGSHVPAQRTFRVATAGAPEVVLHLGASASDEPIVASAGKLKIVNQSERAQLAIVEHLAWTDQATTAAEVTSLQLFRDLFSREVLRPGEQISVGSITIVFTDLKNSTQLYREIGDAPAFGRVLTHFEILKLAVAAEGGCIVKTMGDAIMAAFPRPLAAVRAMIQAHRWLAQPQSVSLPAAVSVPPSSLQPLALKAGVHVGPCLAINQNDRLDYFGTVVNTAARLCAHCTGEDVVLSATVCSDPETDTYLGAKGAPRQQHDAVRLKGLGDTPIEIRRVFA